ncbi:MAG: efflux RND transporter permease subunit [Anaerovoracaceae bacterium]
MSLTKLILKRPVSVMIMIIIIAAFGFSAMTGMEQELTPEMNMPMLVVMTQYSGASPEDVDELVTTVVEDNLSTLDGVESVSSKSSEGSSTVMLEYSYGTDMDDAYSDVSKKLNMISMSIPDACETPVVMELDMNSSASMMLTVSGSPAGGLYNYVNDTMQPELEKLSTVADVTVVGGQKEYISISLDRNAMEQYGLTISAVADAIASADFTASAGETSLGNTEINVSAGQDFETMESLNSIAVSAGTGSVVLLSDVADISMATEESDSVSRYNGEDAIAVSISKNQSSTAGMLSEQVTQVVDELRRSADNVTINIVNDESESISSSIEDVFQTLLLAIFISMVILFLFLGDLKASLIIASSMPVSVLTALILMNAFDYTLNMITMCALVIGVGMMVDNSVVVLESCFRSRAKGLSLFEAAVQGTKEVTASVTAGTITTVVVFLPLAFIEGMVGQLFRPLGFVIIFSLCASLLSALTLVPFAYYRYRPTEREKAPLSRFMRRLTAAYRSALSYLIHRKKTVFGTVALLLAVSLAAVSQVDQELMGATDEGTISVSVTAQQGLKLEKLEEITDQIEEIVSSDDDVEDYILTAGGNGMMSNDGASFSVNLKDDRKRSTDEIISSWKTEMAGIMNCDVEVSNSSAMASMAMSPDTITVALQGSSYTDVQEACSTIVSSMRSRGDVARVSSTFSEGSTLAKIQFDPQLCSAYGFQASSVAATVNQMMNGITATQLTEDGTEYDVVVEYTDEDYQSVEDISRIQVTSSAGYTVDLSDIADIVYRDSPVSINREDGYYNATVDVELNQDALNSSEDVNRAIHQISLPAGVEFTDNSMQKSMNSEFSSLYKAILIAVFLVFAVMAMQFESVRFSLMVMICVPFCFIGSFLMLYFTGTSISMVSLLGFVMLIGTVVNAGILYVDTANRYRETMDRDTALIEAGVTRLRPILMTTLTTICSMIPLAIGSGGNGDMLQGFAVVSIGGLTASTLMALLMLPTFYIVMDKKDKNSRKKWTRLRLPGRRTASSPDEEGAQTVKNSEEPETAQKEPDVSDPSGPHRPKAKGRKFKGRKRE